MHRLMALCRQAEGLVSLPMPGNRHPLYSTWGGMVSRCNSRTNSAWKDYGGRGIKVCARWRVFSNFLADVGERPFGMTLDRIDNDGDYEPRNVRWATKTEQQRNRRATYLHLFTFNGETKTISAWAEQYGMTLSCLRSRIRRWGSVPEVLTGKGE